MMDLGTGLTILGSAVGGAKVVEKILGPTSEYIGEHLKEWTKKKVENTAGIFKNAEKKLGHALDETGKVPPKVLKGILEEGAWCEEEIQVEYFGGALASSRTGVSRDDRGASFISLISRLTTYQLRTHYLFYKLVKRHFTGNSVNMNDGNEWSDLEIFIPIETFYDAMDFTKEEAENWETFLSHVMWGLNKEDLITGFSWGSKDVMKKSFICADSNGIIFQPTKMGIELFMWAFGYGQKNPNDFFMEDIIFSTDIEIQIGKGISTKKAKELARKKKTNSC